MAVGDGKMRGYQAGIVVCVVMIVALGAGFVSTYQNSLNQINSLNADKADLQSQVNLLISDKTTLSGNITLLNNQFTALNESYIDLQQKYEDLLFHYNLLNKPASSFTTVKDLNISLAIDRTIYYYKDPVSGNVTITYLNGTGFEGIFSIYVVPIFGGYGRTDYHSNPIVKNGFADFYLPSPIFVYGPGNYTIGIAGLSTVDGYVIAANLRDPCVQVEAK